MAVYSKTELPFELADLAVRHRTGKNFLFTKSCWRGRNMGMNIIWGIFWYLLHLLALLSEIARVLLAKNLFVNSCRIGFWQVGVWTIWQHNLDHLYDNISHQKKINYMIILAYFNKLRRSLFCFHYSQVKQNTWNRWTKCHIRYNFWFYHCLYYKEVIFSRKIYSRCKISNEKKKKNRLSLSDFIFHLFSAEILKIATINRISISK